MSIAEGVRAELGLTLDADEAEIRRAVESAWRASNLPVFSEDGKEYLVQRLLGATTVAAVVVLLPFQEVKEWRYSSIEVDGAISAELLFAPPDGYSNSPPPTKGENLVIDLWLSGERKKHEIRNIAVLRTISAALDKKALNALCAVLRCGEPQSVAAIENFADDKVLFEISSTSRFVRKGHYAVLLREACLQTVPKWRFLQFYRIFEQGYLDIIFERLEREFKSAPKQALADASRSVESEYEQLRTLVAVASLQSFFEEIADLIDEAKKGAASQNRFAWALERQNSDRGTHKCDKGAAFVYAVRCAIAHAGDRNIFYEQFDDADALVLRLLPTLEAAVFEFVGVNLS